MSLNDPNPNEVFWSAPPATRLLLTDPVWIKPPVPDIFPLATLNQTDLVVTSLLGGSHAFDYQDAGQILTQSLVTKGVVSPDYYAALQTQRSFYQNLQASPYLEIEGSVNG